MLLPLRTRCAPCSRRLVAKKVCNPSSAARHGKIWTLHPHLTPSAPAAVTRSPPTPSQGSALAASWSVRCSPHRLEKPRLRHPQARHKPLPPPLLWDSSAPKRHRHPHRPGPHGPYQCGNDDDLPPRDATPRCGWTEPTGHRLKSHLSTTPNFLLGKASSEACAFWWPGALQQLPPR